MKGKLKCLLLLGSMLWLAAAPPAVWARRDSADSADAVLYETVETAFLLGDDVRDAEGNFIRDGEVFGPAQAHKAFFRKGISALGGTAKASTPFCPPDVVAMFGVSRCTVTAFGYTKVNIKEPIDSNPAFGTGIVEADLSIVLNFDNAIDIAEVAVLTGRINGTLFLQPFGTGSLPPDLGKNKKVLGPDIPIIRLVNGTFTVQVGVDGNGDPILMTSPFTATFRLPFAVDRNGRPDRAIHEQTAFYLSDEGKLIRVQRSEYALGFPMVRAEVTFISAP